MSDVLQRVAELEERTRCARAKIEAQLKPLQNQLLEISDLEERHRRIREREIQSNGHRLPIKTDYPSISKKRGWF